MRYLHHIVVIMAVLATQQAFAFGKFPNDRSCGLIAKACLKAGFVEQKSETKGIWRNCMEPVLLGQSVSGVTVDAAVVKSCRAHKVKELQRQLEQLQNVK